MRSAVRFFIVLSICFSPLITTGNENPPANLPGYSGDLLFFPQIGLQIDGRRFSENSAGYRIQTNRIIDLDIFRIRSIVFSMFVNEFLIFDDSGSSYANPESINYEMDYGRIGWEFRYGILSWFFDHNCSNIFNENQTEQRQLRWYGTGIRWESYGMRPGRRDININFQSSNKINLVNNLNYRISAERSIHTKAFNYKYLITGTLRYDILSYYSFIPFVEGSFTSLIDDRARFNRYLETGIRMHFDKGDFTPFIGINHKHDIDHYNGKEADLYYIGLRMETLLGNTYETRTGKTEGLTFPDLHLSGSYGKFLNNDNLNFNTDIFIGIDFFTSSILSPFISHRLTHNSQAKNSGLFPRYIRNNAEAGVSYRLNFINALVEPTYKYARYDEGNAYKGYIVQYHSAGLRISSREMKTGFANSGIDFEKTSGFEWINRIDWLISGDRVVKEYYYDYIWEYDLKLRWNIFRYKKSIPYISACVAFLKDKNYDRIYDIEPGIRIQDGLYWMLFYRFEYRSAVDTANGLYRSYHLIGVRLEI